MASAHARAIPPISPAAATTPTRSPRARRASAWVLRHPAPLAATNPKAGADVEQVIQSKTKDKSLLLDAANARFSVDEVRAAKERRETRERRRGGSASAAGDASEKRRANHPDNRGRGRGVPSRHLRAPPRVLVVVRDGDGGRMRRGREGTRGGGETSGAGRHARCAVATVSSCRDPGLTGTRGTIVRDTARTLWMVEVGNRNKVVKVPPRDDVRGAAPAPKRETRRTRRGGIVPVRGCPSPTMRWPVEPGQPRAGRIGRGGDE